MTWNLDAVGEEVAPVDHSWSSDDALLYSLGVGAGDLDPFGFELEFTTDNSEGRPQKVLPTFGVTIAMKNSAFALAGTFDPTQSVHGEQSIALVRPIPTEGCVTTIGRLTGIYDKGSGAVVTTETRSIDGSPRRDPPRPSPSLSSEGRPQSASFRSSLCRACGI